MHVSSRLLAIPMFLLLAAIPLAAQSVQWAPLSGPEGGVVRSIARVPDGTLFTTVDGGGLYRSGDNGNSWINVPTQIPTYKTALVHATRTGTLLLAVPDSILYRSTDRGATWQEVMIGGYWSTPLVNDSSGGIINPGLHYLYRSTDDGLTWGELGSRADDEISALTVGIDGRLVEAVERSFSPRGIRTSTDFGTTWRQVQLGDSNTPTVLSLASSRDGRLYAGTGGGGLFRSDDSGATWTFITTLTKPEYYSALHALPDSSIVVATGSRGVYRSGDGGATWDTVGPTTAGLQLLSLGSTSDGRILTGTYSSGIYLVEQAGWRNVSRGLPPLGTQVIAIGADQSLYTVAYNGRFYSSTDNGANWKEPGLARFNGSALTVGRNGKIYVANTNWPIHGVATSSDRGATWTVGTGGIENEQVLVLTVDRDNTIYAGVERGPYTFFHSDTDGLFRSTDGGGSWETIGTGLTGITPQAVVTLSDGTLLVGSRYYSDVLRLLPGDSVWNKISDSLPEKAELTGLIADKVENFYAATMAGLFRSTDRGTSWHRTGLTLGDTSITALSLASSGRIFAATRSQGVYASDDNGGSWYRYGDFTPQYGFDILAVDSVGNLFGGNAVGIYRATNTSSVPIEFNEGDMDLTFRSKAKLPEILRTDT